MIAEEKLDRVVSRFEELGNLLASPEVSASHDFARFSKEYSELTPVVRVITDLRKAEAEAADLEALLDDVEAEEELKDLARDDFEQLRHRIPELEHALQLLLLPTDEADEKNAILEVRDGAAPLDLEALRRFLSERLVSYKLPRSFETTTERLRDDSGKVRRGALREARVGGSLQVP